MLNKLLYLISGQLPARAIFINGQPYMERYFLFRAFGYTAYLHRWNNSDGDRYPHNHPWQNSYGMPLVGHYFEERANSRSAFVGWQGNRAFIPQRRVARFCVNRIKHNHWHRIAHVEPGTWTLFIHSTPRIQHWGFLKPTDTGIAYHPHNTKTNPDWHKTAPRGKHLPNRQPLSA